MDLTPKRSLKREGFIEDFYLIEEEEVLGEGASAVVRKGKIGRASCREIV